MAPTNPSEPRTISLTIPRFKIGKHGLIAIVVIALLGGGWIVSQFSLSRFRTTDYSIARPNFEYGGNVIVGFKPITRSTAVELLCEGQQGRRLKETLAGVANHYNERDARAYLILLESEDGSVSQHVAMVGTEDDGKRHAYRYSVER